MFIRVRIFPNAKREELVKKKPTVFDIYVKEKAERNLANNRCREILANYFAVPVSAIRIVNGHHERTKLISINGLEQDTDFGV